MAMRVCLENPMQICAPQRTAFLQFVTSVVTACQKHQARTHEEGGVVICKPIFIMVRMFAEIRQVFAAAAVTRGWYKAASVLSVYAQRTRQSVGLSLVCKTSGGKQRTDLMRRAEEPNCDVMRCLSESRGSCFPQGKCLACETLDSQFLIATHAEAPVCCWVCQ